MWVKYYMAWIIVYNPKHALQLRFNFPQSYFEIEIIVYNCTNITISINTYVICKNFNCTSLLHDILIMYLSYHKCFVHITISHSAAARQLYLQGIIKVNLEVTCWTPLYPCRLFSWAVMATTWSQVGTTVWWRYGRPVILNSSTSTLGVMLASEPWIYHMIKGKSRKLNGRNFEETICTGNSPIHHVCAF